MKNATTVTTVSGEIQMAKFGDTAAAQHEFKGGKYKVEGWTRPRDLMFLTFHIVGVDFRTRVSNFSGEEEEEYVMFIEFVNPADAAALGLGDKKGIYGVSGTHYRILAQCKDFTEDQFPVEFVSMAETTPARGNAAYELVDPSSFTPVNGEYDAQSLEDTSGETGESTSNTHAAGSTTTPTSAPRASNSPKPSTSTQRPTAPRAGGNR